MRYAKLLRATGTTLAVLLAVLAIGAPLAAQEHKAKHSHYKAVDIPTFGGPESYINPQSVFGSSTQINRRGAAVGGAATPTLGFPSSNGFVCFGTGGVPFVFHAFEWLAGSVTDLGTLAGPDECTEATSINARGQAVGTSEESEIDPVLGLKQIRAVLWEDGEIKNLGTFGGNHSAASANNNRGQVVGFALNAIPDQFSFFDFIINGGVSTGTQTRAFLWQNGRLRDLGTLGGPDASAFAVNERGQVGGGSYVNSTPNPATGIPTIHPFLWENGEMTDLGSLGGTDGGVTALNNRGEVIGSSNLAGDRIADPFFWDGRKLVDLYTSTTGGNVITANAMNDAGQVVGGADFSSTGASPFSAVLWRNGVATNLGTLSGDCYSEAYVINSAAQVVGSSVTCDFSEARAFLWENGSMIDLNERVPLGFPLTLTSAVAINERGEIGGFGAPAGCSDAELCGRAFLLIPTRRDDRDENDLVRTRSAIPQSAVDTSAALTGRAVAARIHGRLHPFRGFGNWNRR
jgi:probable HAF family extracellular repeat protein